MRYNLLTLLGKWYLWRVLCNGAPSCDNHCQLVQPCWHGRFQLHRYLHFFDLWVHVRAKLFGCQRLENFILAWEGNSNLEQWTREHFKSLWWRRANNRQWKSWNPIQEQLSCWSGLRKGRRHLRNRWCCLQDFEVVDRWSFQRCYPTQRKSLSR